MPLLPARFRAAGGAAAIELGSRGGLGEYPADALQTLTVDAAHGVLANDLYQGEGTLIAVVVDPPEQGQLTLDPTGEPAYITHGNYGGTDQFTYPEGCLETRSRTRSRSPFR